jgi:hypothetical protein
VREEAAAGDQQQVSHRAFRPVRNDKPNNEKFNMARFNNFSSRKIL